MTALARLLRWTLAPEKREYLEGDLEELAARRRDAGLVERWRQIRDAFSVCLRHSRFDTPAWRGRLAAAALVLAAAASLMLPGPGGPVRSTIRANDPAGSFTLEFRDRRLVSATLDGRPVEPARLRTGSDHVIIAGGDHGRDFRIALTREGIRWTARRPALPR